MAVDVVGRGPVGRRVSVRSPGLLGVGNALAPAEGGGLAAPAALEVVDKAAQVGNFGLQSRNAAVPGLTVRTGARSRERAHDPDTLDRGQLRGHLIAAGDGIHVQSDYTNAHRYLLGELANLNDRTRSSIISTVSSMLAKLLRGWMAETWSSDTTARFQDAYDGAWLYLDTSPLEYGEYGVYSLVTAKHLAQRTVTRRRIKPDSRAVALMGDEWQAIFVTADRDYQAVCRSQLGCTWAATQNLTGLFSVLGGGQAAEAQAKSWVALFGTKVFGANTDWATNSYASELCGMKRELLMTGSTSHSPKTTVYEALTGGFDGSSGFNEQYQPVVRPEHFVRLRKPEPPHYEADAVVITPRLQQVTGQHWAQATLRPDEE